MKLKHKHTGSICSSSMFNVHSSLSLPEIIVRNEGFGCDSDYIENYDVWLEQSQQWKDLKQAFKDRDVITDNCNTTFFEPPTLADKTRGFTL